MSFIEKVSAMLGLTPTRSQERKPDPIRGDLVRAVQQNKSAGERARAALEDMLNRSDRLRGVEQND